MPTLRQLANAIRFLSIDAIQQANSGHPGMPMGMADIAAVLWHDFLQHNPANPHWLNRDRFVLSNGHGSMLQYALLHLTGYQLSLDEIKRFRQLHSKTPGHPEHGLTPGIETTTGPLGQGLANAVGMALAEKILAAQFNRPGFDLIDHYTYVFLGDGCLMEGISHEVCSLAGTHGLGKLIAFWDDNGISIDGHVHGWFTDNTPQRFSAYGWQVIKDVDGHDPEAVRQAILASQAVSDKPTLICCKTVIGFGAPNLCGTHCCHGSPLGDKEIAAARERLDWHYPPFEIPAEIYAAWDAQAQGAVQEQEWEYLFAAYQRAYPELAEEFLRRCMGKLPAVWGEIAQNYVIQSQAKGEEIATRQASQQCLNAYGAVLPELLGGSADLTPSNLTNWSGSKDVTNANPDGNYIHYGVREFGMFAVMTGMSLHGGFIPYGGTFLVFVNYGLSALRMAALMRTRAIYVLTHDSIGVGEDGPTHQPIEHLAQLRMMLNMSVWRPCDTVETAVAWQYAIEHNTGPTCLALTRQKVALQQRSAKVLANVVRGGYILVDSDGIPELIVIATGSEVGLVIAAVNSLPPLLSQKIRVVSMPSVDVFELQNQQYKESVLPSGVTNRLAVEAGVTSFWYKYVGLAGKVIGIDSYGESAPAQEVFAFLGLKEENVSEMMLAMLDVCSVGCCGSCGCGDPWKVE